MELKERLRGKNIFVYGNDSFKVRVKEVIANDVLLDSGAKKTGKNYFIEESDYVKLFPTEGWIDNLYKLSSASKEMLLYIMTHIDKACDFIEIDVKFYMGKHKISSINTYKKGVEGLVDAQYIYPVFGEKNVFWVNPRYIYRGSRINMYSDRLLVVSEIDRQNPKGGVYIPKK